VILNERIFDAIDAIGANPFIGERQDDLLTGMRCFTIRPHRVFYLVDPGQIEILRVVHSKMNLARVRFS
jgi:plasmid stabilization system protein ParE